MNKLEQTERMTYIEGEKFIFGWLATSEDGEEDTTERPTNLSPEVIAEMKSAWFAAQQHLGNGTAATHTTNCESQGNAGSVPITGA